MATPTSETKPVNPLPNQGDHDRVAMLSLNADGSPDQHNPEIIGDKASATDAAKTQFAQQAVSAVDADKRAEILGVTTDEGGTADAAIDALKAEHDKAASAAEKRAEKTVDSLHRD